MPFVFSKTQWREIEKRQANADDAAMVARVAATLGIKAHDRSATSAFFEAALNRFRRRGITGQRDLERLCMLAAVFGLAFDTDPRLEQAPDTAMTLSDYVYGALASRHALYPYIESGGASPKVQLTRQLGPRARDVSMRWRDLLAAEKMPTDENQLRYLCVLGEYWWRDPRYRDDIQDPARLDAAIATRQAMALRLKDAFGDAPVEAVG